MTRCMGDNNQSIQAELKYQILYSLTWKATFAVFL